MNTNTIRKGSLVRPACDGDSIAWSKIRGTVIDVWQDGAELRAEVHWHHRAGASFGTRVPCDLLVEVTK